MKKWEIICFFVIGIIVLLIPIGTYYLYFGNYPISNDPADWGVFGDYLSGIYGGVYSVVVTILAFYLGRALTKKDSKKEKTRQAAETLYNQIKTIENNNYNRNSIEKLKREINYNELHIPKDLQEDMISLTDMYLEKKDGTGNIDLELDESVKLQLKNLYEQ